MIRLAISVEGQTEEEFVKSVLAPHLLSTGVASTPVLVGGRGGNISVERLAPEMAKLSRNFDFVTSLVDLYGFRRRRPDETAEQLEARIDEAVSGAIGRESDRSPTFAYVQRHEFEGLLFSDVNAFEQLVDVPPNAVGGLRAVRNGFATPEDIDDGPETAPSKRIKDLIPRYRKRAHGWRVAEATGLERIRAECPRFSAWVARLEALGGTGA